MTARHRVASRREAKELTHQALLRAALKLLSRHSFDSISLREVTREAGISPAAFYRHFDDMDELGLELVEESFGSLRVMLRDARARPDLYDDVIRLSVATVVQHVASNQGQMRFIARERYGGVRAVRKAINRELQLFADELSIDLAAFPIIGGWTTDDRRMFANLVVETMVSIAAKLLDAAPGEEDEIAERAIRQLRLISIGAPNWRSGAVPDPGSR